MLDVRVAAHRRINGSGGAAAAEAQFHRRFPDFDPDGSFAALRRREYGRLDAGGHVYLDYTGGGLHAASQVSRHAQLLRSTVLGNPHSDNPTSRAATEIVERARRVVGAFFNASPEEYLCVFTANASAALRLVGEAYPFAPGGTFALSADNHNSVNGIREFARRCGARVRYVPVTAPDLRLDRRAMRGVLTAGDRGARNLLALPAQSNFSGVQHPLEVVAEAHEAGWDVLVDAAAFAPTNRFDVERVRPDFATFSFYKIIGYPTGVGCLLLRRDRFALLRRPWFAGGTVTVASVGGAGHYLRRDEGAFEDGTVDYLNLPAVADGLAHIEAMGRDAVHRRVTCLTAWLLDALTGLRHGNGRPLVQLHGPASTEARGGTVTFLLRDPDGRPVDDRRVEELASRVGISLRTGCFCNPGAAEAAHRLDAAHLRTCFAGRDPLSLDELRARLRAEQGRSVSAVRASLGVASNFADVHRLLCFVQGFLDRPADDVGSVATEIDRQGGQP